MTSTSEPDLEIIDSRGDLIARRVVVGALDTNCWILFHPIDAHAVIIDPGDEPERIIDACHDLIPTTVILTHQHWDHVLGLPEVAEHFGIEVLAHPDDYPVWPHETEYLDHHGHFDAGTTTADLKARGCHIGAPPNRPLWKGTTTPIHHLNVISAGQLRLQVLHTPGHTPGSVSLATPRHVFTGDTLFPGGPGLTGWPLSDFDTIIESIKIELFTLPESAAVHPGHGLSTTIAREKPLLVEWTERGW